MKYSMFDTPLRMFGIPFFEQTHRIERLDKALRDKLDLENIGRRTPGARLAFRTDSPTVTVSLKIDAIEPDIGMSIYSCQSLHVYFGRGEQRRFAGLVCGTSYGPVDVAKTFQKSNEIEDVVIYLPRNQPIAELNIEVEDGAQMLPPTPYKHQQPVLFFGSSITEGAHAASVANAYSALLSHWLDFDYYNFGFSGNCCGQPEIGDVICRLDPSVLVLEYDHNAPSADFLEQTHRPFYEYVRAQKPELPIVMMSSPDFDYISQAEQRRAIIRATYDYAVANGDRNVYFLDGETFFGTTDRHSCTTDTIHPNDLGAFRMASVIRPVLEEILSK
ncbi:MAG: hypothetical protein IJC25_03050 [Clostridia bacterium]|nr:hypothetical protein [Clostridia bacterium]